MRLSRYHKQTNSLEYRVQEKRYRTKMLRHVKGHGLIQMLFFNIEKQECLQQN